MFYGLVGLIFLGLFIGGVRVFGKSAVADARPVALEIRVPSARVLPGHPFYALKFHNLRSWLAEIHGLLAEHRSSTDFLDVLDRYRKDLPGISFEEAFYQSQALLKLSGEFPDVRDSLLHLRADLISALADSLLAGSFDFSLRVSRFTDDPLPAIGFFDDVLRRMDNPPRKARLLSYQDYIASDFHGRYLAGEFYLGSVLDYFLQDKNFFSSLRILDVLRNAFPGSELSNNLQFFRQEFLQKQGGFSFSPAFFEEEFEALRSGLAVLPEAVDARFNYDRALELYSSGLYDRALAQVSLSFSSLHSLYLDSFRSLSDAREEAYAFRDQFQSVRGAFVSRVPLFAKQAEEDIAALLIFVEKGEVPPSLLFSRVRALLVALRESRS